MGGFSLYLSTQTTMFVLWKVKTLRILLLRLSKSIRMVLANGRLFPETRISRSVSSRKEKEFAQTLESCLLNFTLDGYAKNKASHPIFPRI